MPDNNTTMPKPGSEQWWNKHADDKSAVLGLLSSKNDYDYTTWRRISPRLKEDDDVVFAAANNDKIDRLEGLSKRFLDDEKFVSIVVTKKSLHTEEFRHVSYRLRDEKDIVIRSFQKSGMRLQWASERLKKNRSVVLRALKKSGRALRFAPKIFMDDEELILLASKASGSMALNLASSRLRDDKDMALAIIPGCGNVLDELSDRLHDDADIIRAATKANWASFEKASQRLKDDKATVQFAASCHVRTLGYASARLRDNDDLIETIVARSGEALKWASDRLRASKNIVMVAVGNNGTALKHASKKLRGDKDVVLKAVSNKAWSIRHATISARSDKDIILYATSEFPHLLQYAPSELKRDPYLIFDVAFRDCRNRRSDLDFGQNHSCIFQYAHETLKSSRAFVLLAVKNFNALGYFPRFYNDAEIVKASVSLTPETLCWASVDLQRDPSVVLECVRRCTYDVVLCNSRINNGLKPFAERLALLIMSLQIEGDLLLQPLVSVSMTRAERKRTKVSNPPIYASEWIRRQWERVWLVPKLSLHPNWLGLTDIHKCVSEFAGFQKTIQLSDEVKSCEPVVDRLIEMNCILDDIRLRKFSTRL